MRILIVLIVLIGLLGLSSFAIADEDRWCVEKTITRTTVVEQDIVVEQVVKCDACKVKCKCKKVKKNARRCHLLKCLVKPQNSCCCL